MRSSVVASQAELHARYGGVVPEIASRAHVELICDVIEQALVEAGTDARRARRGRGGARARARGRAARRRQRREGDQPRDAACRTSAVHHHEAHLYAAMIEDPQLEPPLVTLIVSGGHTLLIAMDGHGRYRVLGETVDDAAGEAFDKVARFLGLGYPGRPAIDRLAREGDPEAIRFPRPMRDDGLDFSFSGLKTAVVQYVRKHPDADVADVAASFQAAIVDVLVDKLARRGPRDRDRHRRRRAAGSPRTRRCGSGSLDVGGRRARSRLVLPSIALCTDNAAMVAAVAAYRLAADGPTPLDDPGGPEPASGLISRLA